MRVITRLWRLGGRVAIALAVAVPAVLLWVRCGPLPEGLLDRAANVSTVVVDRHGEPLSEVRSASGTRVEWIEPAAVPTVVAAATIAAEDVRFRSHVGVDPIAVARAAWRNARALGVVQGGSTITQQVAKLLLARRAGNRAGRGWSAKAYEAVIAIRLEHRLDKDAILALYLNLAPYGNEIDGIQRAAHAYFGRDPATLTAAEAAFLTALPQQPSRYNPWRDASAAKGRARRILKTMAAERWIDARSYEAALAEKIVLRRERQDSIAPHFVEAVMGEAGTTRPRRIETTLDAGLQRAVKGVIAAHQADLDAHGAANVAVVVLDNARGEWLAWEGSGDYFDAAHGGAIDGATAPRQPGSALKPFTYAAAFERGYHPGRVLADVPSQFPTAEPGVLYGPRNYDGRFRGPLLLRVALAGSENVPAVAVAADIGVAAISRLLRRMGFSTIDRNAAHYGLGITLGNAEVRLDEMVAAYAAIARGGVFLAPRSVTGLDGVRPGASREERILSERTAFWLTDVMADPEARAYVFGRGGSLEFPFTVAAKTGTSQAYHDNWAIGYTRDVTVGVWVGNFDRRPLRDSSGVTGAGPIFHDVMMAAVERVRGGVPIGDYAPILAVPSDVRRATVCAVSGMAPTAACRRRVSEWVPAEATLDTCTWHHESDEGLVTVWPEPYRNWARREGLLREVRASVALTAAPMPTVLDDPHDAAGLTIVSPLAGATYLYDPALRPEFQALSFRTTGASAGGTLRWFVNGAPAGTVHDGSGLRWPLVRGTHAISVRDDSGRSANTSIVVR